MTHTTKYETRDGKTHRAGSAASDPPEERGQAGALETSAETAAPEAAVETESNQKPGKPAKQGA